MGETACMFPKITYNKHMVRARCPGPPPPEMKMTNLNQTTTKSENWVVACGGKEPVMEINGKRYQYHWEKVSGRKAYYCFEDDLFLTDGLEHLLPACLTH